MIDRVLRGVGLEREYAPPTTRTGEGSAFEPHQQIMGERVSIEGSLSIPTVYACIRILADTVGSTPLLTYLELVAGEDRKRNTDSNAWYLLHDSPNPVHTPVDLWTLIANWLVAWGDGFLGKQFARNGELLALWPIHPRDVTVTIENGVKFYEVRSKQIEHPRRYTSREIIHIMGPSFNGIRGMSPIAAMRAELAVSKAAQRYAGAVYQNTGVPRGALKFERELTDEAMKRVRADWNRVYGGSANAGKVAILEEGMDFQQVSMPMRDVQFVEQQQLSVQVIARIFRVPMSMIQADSPGGLTYRTAETENLQFLTHSVRPWYVRIEQELNRDVDLFPDAPVSYSEFLPEALLRVATKERFDAYSVATGGKAWMKPSEVRAAENLPADDEIDEQAAPPAALEPPAEAPADVPEPVEGARP